MREITYIYKLYIRVKYLFWKYYWKIYRPKRPTRYHEVFYDFINPEAVAVGVIMPPERRVKFNSKDYGVVAINARNNVH